MEKLKKSMLIACGGFIILFIFLFIMSSCNTKKYTSEEFSVFLLEKARSYYENNKNLLPQVDGGQTNISISALVEKQEKYLNDITCSGTINVINNSGYYMYTPNINCSDGYTVTKMADHLINKDLVSSGNGLHQFNDTYIYRGDTINNYVIFNKQIWRIVGINNDNTIKLIETDLVINEKNNKTTFKKIRRSSAIWDDRYNSEKSYNSGFNDLIHDGINSRMKDTLDKIYKDFEDDSKAYIVKQNLCIGKRSLTDDTNDGSIECSDILAEQFIGLLPLYEYINASLDPDCKSAESLTCANYNYLATMNNYWSMTAVNANSYDVFKIGRKITDATASSGATPKIVINLNADSIFSKGDGSEANPYLIVE